MLTNSDLPNEQLIKRGLELRKLIDQNSDSNTPDEEWLGWWDDYEEIKFVLNGRGSGLPHDRDWCEVRGCQQCEHADATEDGHAILG